MRATGSVSGYAAGLYATVYANDVTRLGAYADAWLQYGRYDNRVSSELGTARYGSSVWTASLETGYAFKPFAAGSALADIVVEPRRSSSTAATRPKMPRCKACACATVRAAIP